MRFRTSAVLALAACCFAPQAYGQGQRIRALILAPEMPLGGTRGIGATSKRGMSLDVLIGEKKTSRGSTALIPRFSREMMVQSGIDPDSPDPVVTASVTLQGGSSVNPLKQAGATVMAQAGSIFTVRAPLSALVEISALPEVQGVSLLTASRLGRVKSNARAIPQLEKRPLSFTGKGVAIAVIDTGIDWRHADFIKPDGSTRILALYDIFDDSWKKSGGKIGTEPPFVDENGPLGTVYTGRQINLALRGKLTLKSTDEYGHGTAVAGTAAGNGRAAAKNARLYAGVAPESSLIVIRAGKDAALVSLWGPFTQWAKEIADAHRMPLVVNISGGSQLTAHDGRLPEELQLDQLVGKGKRGVALVTSAGNEREDQIVATGRYSARVRGSVEFEGKLIEIISRPSDDSAVPPLVAYMPKNDQWGMMLTGEQAPFLDTQGHPLTIQITKSGDRPMIAFSAESEIDEKLKTKLARAVQIGSTDTGDDQITIPLPQGSYTLTAFGAGPKVSDGRYLFQLPFAGEAFFSRGATPKFLVASPGNSSNVITVGAYNCRDRWQSRIGPAGANIELGEIAWYSSPGLRRDGGIKPDLAAPGSYLISSLAAKSFMGKEAMDEGGARIAKTGKHLAWEGTSAASPYVAGVVALMLQKNPTLDADQIRRILITTTRRDRNTGAVPNSDWGYGKIDVERALAATPARRG